MTLLAAFCCSFAAGTNLRSVPPATAVVLDRPVPELVTGSRFESELRRPLTASWRNVPLRTVFRRISASRKISLLLDRRIDPTKRVAIDISGESLLEGIDRIAANAGGTTSIVGNVVVVGPPASLSKLRTLVELRTDELKRQADRLPKERLLELSQRRTLHWNDLDRPADLLRQIARRHHLQLEGLKHVPHDLWAGATLPSVSAAEALSMVLIQFDLTFAWRPDAAGVRIVPVSKDVAVERFYTPRGTPAAAAAREWTERFPGLRAEAKNDRVLVRGTVEQHEAVAALLGLNGGGLDRGHRPQVGPRATPPTPLSHRTFVKLKFQRVPAIALIRRLEQTGIVFQYDEKQLATAGIDLNTPISMDLKDATAEEVFAALCKPLGLKYAIDGLTVTLSPR